MASEFNINHNLPIFEIELAKNFTFCTTEMSPEKGIKK